MDSIKKHFEEEAKEFDALIIKLIPFYQQMLDALVQAVPFNSNASIRIIDLGCGTGTIAQKLAHKFPNAEIYCLDIASNMIEIAQYKLSNHANSKFIVGDFSHINFVEKFEVVVSSLALHHLETDDDKKEFYSKIFKSMKNNGVFYNADILLASTDYLQTVNLKKWKDFMLQSVSKYEIENKWIPTYEKEDKPAKLINQLRWLQEIGFSAVDVIWKYYNFGVYGGIKW